MKKFSIIIAITFALMAILFTIVLESCSKVTTPERAAKYGARCGSHL